MFGSGCLLVSVPTREVAHVALPGSIYELADLVGPSVTDDLRLAIDLVAATCSARGTRMAFLARPEIFVDPVTLQWLQDRLGSFRHHLCISDGTAMRVLPDVHNHIFLYRLGIRQNAEAFVRLAHRAPAFLGGLSSQINTTFQFQVGGRPARPPTQLLQSPDEAFEHAAQCLSFHDDVEWTMDHGAVQMHSDPGVERASYIPLTETALADDLFLEIVGALVAEAYFDPSARVLLRLPVLPEIAATMAERMAAAVTAIRRAKPSLPRVRSTRVVFLTHDLGTTDLAALGAPVTLLMHESFDFWRHPVTFYAGFAHVQVLAALARRGSRTALRELLTAAFGRPAQVRWLRSLKTGFP